MKKIFLISLAISVLSLSGCFWFGAGNSTRPAAEETAPAQTVPQSEPSIAQNGQAQVPEPPSFQDGDYYLQAIAARNDASCEKISNEELKVRCKGDVKAMVAK